MGDEVRRRTYSLDGGEDMGKILYSGIFKNGYSDSAKIYTSNLSKWKSNETVIWMNIVSRGSTSSHSLYTQFNYTDSYGLFKYPLEEIEILLSSSSGTCTFKYNSEDDYIYCYSMAPNLIYVVAIEIDWIDDIYEN